MRLSNLVLAVCFVASTASAQHLLSTYTGSVGDEFGAALFQTADQNNDGFVDLLIGAPGNNGGRGYIRCLSGKFIATGVGPVVLWTLFPNVNAGARFGTSIAEVATLTGDAATDFVVGAPGFIAASGSSTGAVFLIDGSTHTVATILTGENNTRFGEALVAVGDQDGDGKIDLAATGPALDGTSPSWVYSIPGSSLASSASINAVPHSKLNSNSSNAWGRVLASGFDLDGDGLFELAIGSPQFFAGGSFSLFKPNSWAFIGGTGGSQAGESFGSSIDARHDFNGDGVVDFVIGSPNWSLLNNSEDGRAVVLSGAFWIGGGAPFQLYELKFANGITPQTTHFGAAVCSSADLNHDGVADFIIGAPEYHTLFPFGPGKGAALVYSGATGARIGGVFGLNNDRLGDELLGAFLDLNADGFTDFAVAGSLSDNSTADCGALKFYSLFPTSWSTYCTSKVNSQGCTPSMSASGVASATSAAPFQVMCSNELNQKSGLLMYGQQPIAAPFQGGYLCVNTPLKRTLSQNSGGSLAGTDCTGSFSFDFNALIHGGLDPTLVVGAEVFCQYWSRDPLAFSHTNLSNALNFLINP